MTLSVAAKKTDAGTAYYTAAALSHGITVMQHLAQLFP